MRLWKLTRTDKWGYDDFDSAIVAANTEQEARSITPDGDPFDDDTCWASAPERVLVERLGTAKKGTQAGVVLASFNAG
jgi:hypothetical protein